MNSDILVFYAKSFYNAYIALEQINQASEDQLLYFIPVMVNGAFSIELTLKAILTKNQIEYDREHNLLVLFRLLPKAYQSELIDNLIKKAPEYSDTDKLVEELLLVSNAFVDWRYSFEGSSGPAFETRFLSAFANAAICTLFAHYNVSFTPHNASPEDYRHAETLISENREKYMSKNLKIVQQRQAPKKNQG